MRIPLEDLLPDIIGKARRGLRLTEAQLCQQAGISFEQLEGLQGGEVDVPTIGKVATVLDLEPRALYELGAGKWQPDVSVEPPGFAAFNLPFEDLTVNTYLAWDRESGRAAAFDTGGDCAPMLDALKAHDLTLTAIFLTHTHFDHIADLDDFVAETGAPVYVSEREKFSMATPIAEGRRFPVGGLTITARLTPGHSPGGLTYVVEGVDPLLAIVGDALFAGSMGGVTPDGYAAARRANRQNILSLPGATVICPGHGPLTTVAQEKMHNPFYAGAG